MEEFDADIIILTETNSAIKLKEKYKSIATETLESGFDGVKYEIGENRTTIWTKYKIVNQKQTFDNFYLFVEIETPKGLLKCLRNDYWSFGGIG